MKRIALFAGFLIVNCLLVYLANQWLPENFVLGNARWSALVAVGVSGLLITLLLVVGVLVKTVGNKMSPGLGAVLPTLIYFWVVNFVAIWVVARLAEVSGLGISKFTYAAGWAVVAGAVQWGMWTVLGPKESMDRLGRAEDEEESEE